MSAQVGPQWRMAYAEKVRQAMGPEFAAIADALRGVFGADVKLTWLETPTMNHGVKPEEGVPTHWSGERRRA